ncbi:MAG TPA: hypothetical protein VGE37_07610 [Archangium sp.]
MKRLALVAVLVLGSFIAWAAPGPVIDLVPRWLKAGLYIGPTATVATAAKNKITTTVTADVDYDFPNTTIVCNNSWNVTATGVKKGDPCMVGVGPRDGGTAIVAANSNFLPIATADDTVVVRHCPAGTAIDPADAGYVVRCFSSQ